MLCSVWSLHGWRLWYLELKHEPLYEYLGTSFLSSVFHQIGHFSTKPSHTKNWFAFSTSELQQSQLQRRKWEHWDLWAQQILWTWTTHFKWCICFQFRCRHIVRLLKVDKFDWNGNALIGFRSLTPSFRRKDRGGGYFRNFWVGMCRLDPGTLNLYQS